MANNKIIHFDVCHTTVMAANFKNLDNLGLYTQFDKCIGTFQFFGYFFLKNSIVLFELTHSKLLYRLSNQFQRL